MHIIKSIACSLLACCLLHSCRESPTLPPVRQQPPQIGIRIELQYADFTEILLNVSVTDTLPGSRKQFALMRNGEQILYDSFLGKDTTITDRGLAPNTLYQYRAYAMTGSRFADSASVPAKTRAYGSHDWRFEIDSLGEDQSAAVSIFALSRDDAWVAGTFLKHPAEHSDYNAIAHWDGARWRQEMIFDPNGLPEEGFLTFGLPPNDIWFVGGWIYRFNSTIWKALPLTLGSLNDAILAVYGNSNADIYFVGIGGSMTHWDGSRFSEIPSPTTCDLLDIWGDEGTLYAAGASLDNMRSAVVKIAGTQATLVDTLQLPNGNSTTSVWFRRRDSVFAYGGEDDRFIYRGQTVRPPFPRESLTYTLKVRGTGPDNIWWAGHNLQFMHYDGSSWRQYQELSRGGSVRGLIYSLEVHEDYLFACGFAKFSDGKLKAIVVRGYRE